MEGRKCLPVLLTFKESKPTSFCLHGLGHDNQDKEIHSKLQVAEPNPLHFSPEVNLFISVRRELLNDKEKQTLTLINKAKQF